MILFVVVVVVVVVVLVLVVMQLWLLQQQLHQQHRCGVSSGGSSGPRMICNNGQRGSQKMTIFVKSTLNKMCYTEATT